MKKLLVIVLMVGFSGMPSFSNSLKPFFDEADIFFKRYVEDGRVDYKAIKKNFHEIETLYAKVKNMPLSGKSENEKKAFYINAYNLCVIYQVSTYYPLKSVMDQSGFFDEIKHAVAGEEMTLNNLETKYLLMKYRDPRIHFALVCAAISCPELASFAYMPESLDFELTRRTELALNDDSFIRVRKDFVEISKIFEWYKDDFTGRGNTVLQFINTYRKIKLPTTSKIVYYEYDWSLNTLN
ncbi:MAG: DUF547 domain-containing protein [Cyclobacteriaceae bacterium]|nr:DUF547 domain-containing protein [Cyclobacteriaceae bacterium]